MLLVLKIGGGMLLTERGLVAEYFANESWRPPVERSVEYPRAAFTRVDQRLDFGPDASHDVPLFFVNDFQRFNYYQPGKPARTKLPYSASWTGFLLLDGQTDLRLYLRGPGVRGEMTVDGFRVASLSPSQKQVVGTVSVRKGWRRVGVEVSAPYGSGRALSAGLIDETGRERPFDRHRLFVSRVSTVRLVIDRVVRALAIATDAGLLLWLASAAFRIRSVSQLLWAAAVIEAWVFARPWVGRLMVLDGGSDPLTYETYARDILLNEPLLKMGRAVGQGVAFYYQPLYPYLLSCWRGPSLPA